jgi:drug/metabolite transporter (DMT)-like permease
MLGTTARTTGRPITVSASIFITGGLICAICAFIFETPSIESLQLSWASVLYTGILSTAIGFTLHTISQQHVPTANAALILSMEALFAAIGAAIVLGERLPPMGYVGVALIFAAIILAEAGPPLLNRMRRKPAPVV